MINPEKGYAQQKSTKEGMPQQDNSQESGNRSNSDEIYKRSDELKDKGMPQCKMVANIRHRMSPYKTLQDMLNDNAMKTYILNQQMFKQDHTSQKLK